MNYYSRIFERVLTPGLENAMSLVRERHILDLTDL